MLSVVERELHRDVVAAEAPALMEGCAGTSPASCGAWRPRCGGIGFRPAMDFVHRHVTGILFTAATVATLIAGLCCWPAPSEAYIEHPWCTRSGSTSCGFDSYEQCMENARLLTQTNCVANPWIHPLPQAPPHAHARGAAARGR